MQVHASEITGTLPSGVYNLVGDDIFWISSATEKFVSIVGKDSLSVHFFDRVGDMNNVIGSLLAISFTMEPNVVVLKDCGDFALSDSKGHKALQEVLGIDITPNYLVMVNAALDSKEKKLVNTVNCTKLKKYDCIKYAEKLFPYGIDRNAINTLLDYTACDLARIFTESEKLIAYCGKDKVGITAVEDLVVEDADLQIFNFVNNAVSGNNDLALKQLNKLKLRGESNSAMLAMLVNQFRRMLHCTLSKKSDAELAAIFKVQEYAIIKARENRNFSVIKLKSTLEMLTFYELKFKSGEMSDLLAFDSAICRLLSREVN